jgi:hypothetical protein
MDIRIKAKNGDIHEFEFFEWWGLRNPNTCVFQYYCSRNDNIEMGIQILPLMFWQAFGFSRDYFKDRRMNVKRRRRIVFGLGFFELFYDVYDNDA